MGIVSKTDSKTLSSEMFNASGAHNLMYYRKQYFNKKRKT
jgi:hypothetical protein